MKFQFSWRLAVVGLGSFLFAGCASEGVMQLSANTYMVSKTSAAGAFANRSAMQADAIKEANAFAATKGKIAVATNTQWDRPAQGFPTFTYQFALLDPDDPRAKDVSLKPAPNIVIEKNENIKTDVKTKSETVSSPDLYSQLMKLDDLHKKGILTDAEFETQKQRLLAAQ